MATTSPAFQTLSGPSVVADTGSIVGRVTKNGQGVLGAHVWPSS